MRGREGAAPGGPAEYAAAASVASAPGADAESARGGDPSERTARRRSDARPAGYYGIPPIHAAHWGGLIHWYFFLGGVSAGSYVVAAVADLVGRPEDRPVVRVGRYLAALLAIPCPILLILDLGRPERFLNMFRVVKLRSPMSLGTWGLLLYGGFTALSAAIQAGQDGLLGARGTAIGRLPGRAVAAVGSLFGFFVGGYTGVLLGATAVPFWARNARLLGPLFLASALSASCAAIGLVVSCLPGRRHGALGRLERAEGVAAAAETLALAAVHANSGRLGAPLLSGRLGALHLAGSVGAGVVGPAVIRALGRRFGLPRRPTAALASLSALVGGFILKHAVVEAGRLSAHDPEATFAFARDDRPARGGPAAPRARLGDGATSA